MKFKAFCYLARSYCKNDCNLFINLFNFDTVIYSCQKSLKLSMKEQFFLYLHIDEFQLVDAYDKNDKTSPPKELFKNMISNFSTYLVPNSPLSSSTFVLPFLSGTAPHAVLKQKNASTISFEFIECPLLSTASMIRIMDHFAMKFKAPTYDNHIYKWKLCAPLLQLLLDTGGLPRALEQLLIRLTKSGENCETFFQELESQNFNNIFDQVKYDLDSEYNIKHYVEQNERLATKILYYCIEGIPVARDTILDDLKNVKVKDLERDGRVVLSKDNESKLFIIHMPFFFVCIYNDVLKLLDVKLINKLTSQVNGPMYCQK
jgi:hypothetical protein